MSWNVKIVLRIGWPVFLSSSVGDPTSDIGFCHWAKFHILSPVRSFALIETHCEWLNWIELAEQLLMLVVHSLFLRAMSQTITRIAFAEPGLETWDSPPYTAVCNLASPCGIIKFWLPQNEGTLTIWLKGKLGELPSDQFERFLLPALNPECDFGLCFCIWLQLEFGIWKTWKVSPASKWGRHRDKISCSSLEQTTDNCVVNLRLRGKQKW